MRREVLLLVLASALASSLAHANKAECRVAERVVPCELVEQCMALGGVLRDRNGALMCCFADERCTEAGALRNDARRQAPSPGKSPTESLEGGSRGR